MNFRIARIQHPAFISILANPTSSYSPSRQRNAILGWLTRLRTDFCITWSEAKAWLVGDYLLMPDHLHLFCAPRDLHFTIETWISYWKREFTLKIKRLEAANQGGASIPASRFPQWKFQSRGWHHRLRDGESYSEKWLYVQENPLRKNLCTQIDDWPFKGKVFDLIWTGK